MCNPQERQTWPVRQGSQLGGRWAGICTELAVKRGRSCSILDTSTTERRGRGGDKASEERPKEDRWVGSGDRHRGAQSDTKPGGVDERRRRLTAGMANDLG